MRNRIRVIAILANREDKQSNVRPDHAKLREQILIPGELLQPETRSLGSRKYAPYGRESDGSANYERGVEFQVLPNPSEIERRREIVVGQQQQARQHGSVLLDRACDSE